MERVFRRMICRLDLSLLADSFPFKGLVYLDKLFKRLTCIMFSL